jgi:peroxiredoxin
MMMPVGADAPDFQLPDPQGRLWSLSDFKGGEGLLVAFICNHCPFVQHILPGLVSFTQEYEGKGLKTVAISSNDIEAHPEDAPEHMAALAKELGFNFPYLVDETQQVALAYQAICTPDFFLFDQDHRLFYAGQFCDSRPKLGHPPVPGAPPQRTDLPVTGADLRRAADALLSGQPAPSEQRPSAGCSIKWKDGNEPVWG